MDVPEELFDFVLDDKCMLYAHLRINHKVWRAREASQVISFGLPSLERDLVYIEDEDSKDIQEKPGSIASKSDEQMYRYIDNYAKHLPRSHL